MRDLGPFLAFEPLRVAYSKIWKHNVRSLLRSLKVSGHWASMALPSSDKFSLKACSRVIDLSSISSAENDVRDEKAGVFGVLALGGIEGALAVEGRWKLPPLLSLLYLLSLAKAGNNTKKWKQAAAVYSIVVNIEQ